MDLVIFLVISLFAILVYGVATTIEDRLRRQARLSPAGLIQAIQQDLRVEGIDRASEHGLVGRLGHTSLALEVEPYAGKEGVVATLKRRDLPFSLINRAPQEGQPAPRPQPVSGVGDPAFDACFLVEGDLGAALATLSPERRRTLVAGLNRPGVARVDLRRGLLDARLLGTWDDSHLIAAAVRALAQITEELSPPSDVNAALLQIARHDPAPARRLRALVVLSARVPWATWGPVLESLAGSDAPLLRLLHAIGTGDLEALAGTRDTLPGLLDDDVYALQALRLDHLEPGLRRRLGVALLGLGHPRLLAQGAQLLAGSASQDDREAEAALLGCALRETPPGRQELARALGQIGGVTSVPALKELARAHPEDPAAPLLLEAARTIQARLVGAEAGQIRVAPKAPEVGAIRVEEDRERQRGAMRVAREGGR